MTTTVSRRMAGRKKKTGRTMAFKGGGRPVIIDVCCYATPDGDDATEDRKRSNEKGLVDDIRSHSNSENHRMIKLASAGKGEGSKVGG